MMMRLLEDLSSSVLGGSLCGVVQCRSVSHSVLGLSLGPHVRRECPVLKDTKGRILSRKRPLPGNCF